MKSFCLSPQTSRSESSSSPCSMIYSEEGKDDFVIDVSDLNVPSNEWTWNARATDTLMTSHPSPEREPPKTSTKRSAALRSPTGITPLGIYPVFIAIKGGGRPTRRLPHAKMLLVPISSFLCWVAYALEGSTFSLSKCDFSRLFHTERSWYTYRFTVVFVSARQDLPSDPRAFSFTSFEA